MYEPHYEEVGGGAGFLMGLVCGTALGAAIGLMFAPKSGTELRQTIATSTDQWRRKAADAYEQASEGVTNVISKGRSAMERGREAFDTARQTATERGKEMFDRSRPTTSEVGPSQPS